MVDRDTFVRAGCQNWTRFRRKTRLLHESLASSGELRVVKSGFDVMDFSEPGSTNQEQKHYIFVRYNVLVGSLLINNQPPANGSTACRLAQFIDIARGFRPTDGSPSAAVLIAFFAHPAGGAWMIDLSKGGC